MTSYVTEGATVAIWFEIRRPEWPIWQVVTCIEIESSRMEFYVVGRFLRRSSAERLRERLATRLTITHLDSGKPVRLLEDAQ